MTSSPNSLDDSFQQGDNSLDDSFPPPTSPDDSLLAKSPDDSVKSDTMSVDGSSVKTLQNLSDSCQDDSLELPASSFSSDSFLEDSLGATFRLGNSSRNDDFSLDCSGLANKKR